MVSYIMEKNTNNPQLSIISVYHNTLAKQLLEANYALTKRLNPETPFVWYAGDNTPHDFNQKLNADEFMSIRNAPIEDFHNLGSHHHASAINRCIKEVKTRYVLSLDSDYFIVRPNWINEVIGHMQKNNLAVFGVPYYVQDWQKYRYFPCVVGMVVDCHSIPLSTLDFFPLYTMDEQGSVMGAKHALKKTSSRISVPEAKKNLFLSTIKSFLVRCESTLSVKRRRAYIGTARDTGYGIYTNYGSRPDIRSECVTGVLNRAQMRKELVTGLNTLYELLLPDQLCYLPKDKRYYTDFGFASRGYFDVAALGWEEYIWKDVPFGMHVHGSIPKLKKRGRTPEQEIELVRNALDAFPKQLGGEE